MTLPSIKELAALIVHVKKQVPRMRDRGARDYIDVDGEYPTIQLTVGADKSGWSYQTGDNSYTGGCYSYRHWSVQYVMKRTNALELARIIKSELKELLNDEQS